MKSSHLSPFLYNRQKPSFDIPTIYAISNLTQSYPSITTSKQTLYDVPTIYSYQSDLSKIEATTRREFRFSKKRQQYNKQSMKAEIMNRSTIASQASHPQLNLSQISSFSMTPQQRKLHERGLYFPEEILFEASVQLNKGDQLWTQPYIIQLTTQSFGQIPLSLITKIKLYHGNEEGIVTLKIMVKEEIFIYKLKRKGAFELFAKVAWGRLATMNLFSSLEEEAKEEIDGAVYKRTEYLKCWEVRTLKVSKEGLRVFKGGKEQICLRIEKTSELWTRFDTIKQERYLVVKMRRGATKEEIGVPIQQATKWLHALCRILG